MPSRRTHSKSRTGCHNCKRRHLKCDEARPTCAPCVKRELSCVYPSVEANYSSPATNASTPPATPVGVQRLFQPDRTTELGLLHHYSTSTYKSLPERNNGFHFLQVVIPKLALSHGFLLDTIFALSALHLEYLDDTKSKTWLPIALDYQHRALAAFNHTLTHVTSQNCEAVAVCSMFMIMNVIAIPGVSGDEDSPDPVSEILGLRNLLRGIIHILTQSADVLLSGELEPWFRPLLQRKPSTGSDIENQNLNPEDAGGQEKLDLYNSIMQELKRMHVLIDAQDSPNRDLYQSTCSDLEELCISAFPSNLGGILGWPLKIPPALFALFEQEDPMAKIIFIHFGVVLHLITDKWFGKNAGKRLVGALLPSFGTVDPETMEILTWARNCVGIPTINV